MAFPTWSMISRWLTPARHDPDRQAGDAARDRGDWAESAAAYGRYLERRPGHVAVWIRLGNMLKETGDGEGADRAYVEAARLAPSRGDPWRARGDLLASMGDAEAAGSHYAEAWRLDRNPAAGAALSRPGSLGRLARLQTMAGGAWRIEGAVDGLRDLAVEGWAWNPARPDVPATVAVTADGREIGRVVADIFRPDVTAHGLAPERCGFRFDLGGSLAAGPLHSLEFRIVETAIVLAGSPLDLSPMVGLQRWLARPRPAPGPPGPPLISIVTPVHDVRPDWFEQAISSVLAQADGRWEWIVVDDGSRDRALTEILDGLSARDSRIRLLRSPHARGTAVATNLGLAQAGSDHVLFLDHDDVLEPEAVARLIIGIEMGGDVIYGDEVVTGPNIGDFRLVVARPAFSWRYYLSHPYFVHPVCVRRSLAGQGLDETLSISADVDFVLGILERASRVVHVPGILYRWRSHADSLGRRAGAAATEATIAALHRHFDRLKVGAKAVSGAVFNTFRVDFRDPGGRVLVVIPTRDRADLLRMSIGSLLATTPPEALDIVVIDHDSSEPELAAYLESLGDRVRVMPYSGPFNYSRMNNQAVERFGGDHDLVLFLNNDVEALEPGWLERMRALAVMEDVGAVGATLLYPDNRIQHAGVVIGPGGFAEHAMKFAPLLDMGGRNPGYNCSLTAVRDWSAVTGACLMMPLDVFRAVGGFDETLPVGFNDTDLCLRVGERGLSVVNDGWAVLRHHESATRGRTGGTAHPEDAKLFAARWQAVLTAGDPFYNPMLSLDRDHSPDRPDTDRLAPRLKTIDLRGLGS
jgi:glycosyltransferase involved in cell wall biosynthesis